MYITLETLYVSVATHGHIPSSVNKRGPLCAHPGAASSSSSPVIMFFSVSATQIQAAWDGHRVTRRLAVSPLGTSPVPGMEESRSKEKRPCCNGTEEDISKGEEAITHRRR